MKHDTQADNPPNRDESESNSFVNEETINPIKPRADFLPQTNTPDYSFDPATENQSPSIQTRAKAMRPAIKSCVNLIDAAGIRVLQNTARNEGWEPEEIDTLEKRCRMQGDTYEIIVDAGSRIAARHIKNEEYLDWACLLGGLTEWGSTLIVAIREIKKDSKVEYVEEITEEKPDKE